MRVVVADDSLLTREGIAHLLRTAGVDVVALANDGDELLEAVAAFSPDVAVVDIRMPPTHSQEGLHAARAIRETHAGVGVLILSQYVEAGYAVQLIEQHPEKVGYLLKERVFDPSVLVDAIRRVHEGETVVDPTIVSFLFGKKRRHDPLASLSAREREVLALVAEGLSNRAIAERLYVNERTVEAHVSRLMSKLSLESEPGTHRRVLAVLAFLQA